MIAEEYSVQAHEADNLLCEYLSSGKFPPANLIEQQRYYLQKRIRDYVSTRDIRPLLDYFGIEYENCSECSSVVLANVNDIRIKFVSREELIILAQGGIPVNGLNTFIDI